MGARGPLKVIQGGGLKSVGAQPDSAAAMVQAVAPKKPDFIEEDDTLSGLWDDIVPGLDAAGLLSTADMAAVAAAIMHFAAMRKAYGEFMTEGISVGTEGDSTDYLRKHPSEAVFRMESREFLEYARQLGMTWLSRARTAIPKGENESGNPFQSDASSG